MGGSVNFRNYLHSTVLCKFLKIAKLLLCIIAIAGSEAGICVTLQAKSSISLVPITLKMFRETIVVKMHLQAIHLIITHDFHQLAQIRNRYVLAAAINHKTTHGKVGVVLYCSFGKLRSARPVDHLQQSARSPIESRFGRSRNNHLVTNLYDITLTTLLEFLFIYDFQNNITTGRFHTRNT